MNPGDIKCEVLHKTLDQDMDEILESWRSWNENCNEGFMFQSPDFLEHIFSDEKKNIHLFFILIDGKIAGIAPFCLRKVALECKIGEVTIFNFYIQRMYLLGEKINSIPNIEIYDKIFNIILSLKDLDALYFQSLDIDSYLYHYLSTSTLIKKYFSMYAPTCPKKYSMINLSGTFDEYMKKFSKKTQHNRMREIRKFERAGKSELVCITREEDVEDFINLASEVSRKTYQYNLLKLGLRDIESLQKRLKTLAKYGWLRSYLLKLDDVPCSFMIGYQDKKNFYPIHMGYDPKYSNYEVGNVLLFLILQDLFRLNTHQYFQFGMGGGFHKDFFSNCNYTETSVYFFKKKFYSLLSYKIYQFFIFFTNSIKFILDFFHIKKSIKKMIRYLSTIKSK